MLKKVKGREARTESTKEVRRSLYLRKVKVKKGELRGLRKWETV